MYRTKPRTKKIHTRKYKKKNNASRTGVRYTSRAIVPRIMRLKMPYVSDAIKVDCDAGVFTSYMYNFNSIFDPDRTGIGHQPMGHDQWISLYDRYLVTGAQIQVDAWNITDASPFKMAFGTNHNAFGPTDFATATENPRFRTIIGGGQYSILKLRKYLTASQVMQITNQRFLSDNSYSALFGASPTNIGTMQLFFQSFGSPQNLDIYFIIRIVYYVTLSEPVVLLQS